MDAKQIFEQALKDPELISTIDVDKLLDSLQDQRNDYLENKTLKEINEHVFEKINAQDIELEQKKLYCSKLIEYYPIDKVYELHKGKHIRWLRNNIGLVGQEPKLFYGTISENIVCTF